MDFTKTCDKIIDYSLLHGELISMTAWKKKTQEYRRSVAEDMTNPKALISIAKGKFHFIDEKEVYNNPFVYDVNPAHFVYDCSQKDNWDDCPKIYKSYKSPEDIINNKYYKVSKDDAECIRAMVKGGADRTESKLNEDLEEKVVNGGTVEVLEHWGNLRLENGTLLKNWHCVVVARKFVVRFEKNQQIGNPFTYATLIEDPEQQEVFTSLLHITTCRSTRRNDESYS